jgi:hypothetical protein
VGGKIEGKGGRGGEGERERGGGKLAFLENCPFSPPPSLTLSLSLPLSLSLSHFTAPFLIFRLSSFQHVVLVLGLVLVVVVVLVVVAVLVVGVDPASPGAPG